MPELSDRCARRHAADLEHVEVDCCEDRSSLDLLHGGQNAVDADHDRRPVRCFQGLEHTERHTVVRGEHGVDPRMFGKEFFHDLSGIGLLIVADAGAEQLDTRKLGERPLIAANALTVGRRRRRAFDDDDLSLAAEVLEQIAGLAVPDRQVVGANVGYEFAGEGI